MKQMLKYLGTPLAFVVAFLLFGTPNALGVTAIENTAGVSIGVGGCALAFGPGEDERDLPDTDDSGFDDFMCMTSYVAGTYAAYSAYTAALFAWSGGTVSGGALLVAGGLGVYAWIVGATYC